MAAALHQTLRKHGVFADELSRLFRQRSLSFVVGAGVSASAGLPTWPQLISRMARLERIAGGSSLGSLRPESGARYLADHYRRPALHRLIGKALYGRAVKSSHLLDAVADAVSAPGTLNCISTNYDDLLEDRIRALGGRPQAITNGTMNRSLGRVPVVHIHGYIPKPPRKPKGDIIFTEEDYHRLYNTGFNWQTLELLDGLRRSSCVFVGHSMTDPNIRRIIDLSRSSGPAQEHYALIVRAAGQSGTVEQSILESMGLRVMWTKSADLIAELLQTAVQFGTP